MGRLKGDLVSEDRCQRSPTGEPSRGHCDPGPAIEVRIPKKSPRPDGVSCGSRHRERLIRRRVDKLNHRYATL